MLLSGKLLVERLKEPLATSKQCSLYSAFISDAGFEFIKSTRTIKATDRLLVRCTPDDVANGVCSLTALTDAINLGFEVRILSTLHAKIYAFDNLVFVGSSNLTGKGLDLMSNSNEELNTQVIPSCDDLLMIEELWELGTNVTIECIKNMLNFMDLIDERDTIIWPDEVYKGLKRLSLSDFPSDDQANHLKWTSKNYIFKCRAYKWLVDLLEHCGSTASFGYISAQLHDALDSDFTYYRREIKERLANFIAILQNHPELKIIVERPSYSQVLRLIE